MLDNTKSVTATIKKNKTQPFGSRFTTKLTSVNSKLLCALSLEGTCSDDPDPCIDIVE